MSASQNDQNVFLVKNITANKLSAIFLVLLSSVIIWKITCLFINFLCIVWQAAGIYILRKKLLENYLQSYSCFHCWRWHRLQVNMHWFPQCSFYHVRKGCSMHIIYDEPCSKGLKDLAVQEHGLSDLNATSHWQSLATSANVFSWASETEMVLQLRNQF